MSRNTITVDASPQVVYGVLVEPPCYGMRVVGNKSIRTARRLRTAATTPQRLPPRRLTEEGRARP
jgi:hypothetical protein